jgi:anionic cell wall polymer biosynthesis LytR-Cps2A-Psr (LCP) family protein
VNGVTALEYARDRHSFAASDLARISNQQSLLASLLRAAISSRTLADPLRLSAFLRAALGAIKVDSGLNLAELADQLKGITLHEVQFVTVPLSNLNYATPTGESAVLWNAPAAHRIFAKLRADQPLSAPASGRHHRAAHPAAHPRPANAAGGTASGGSSRTAAQAACP